MNIYFNSIQNYKKRHGEPLNDLQLAKQHLFAMRKVRQRAFVNGLSVSPQMNAEIERAQSEVDRLSV